MVKKHSRKQPESVGSYHPEMIPVEKLRLDAENPRLASGRGSQDKLGLVKILWIEMDVEEIALSILANGFLREESLLVFEPDKKRKEYIVVEGNRRLAAVLLLRDESLRNKVGATKLGKLSAQEFDALNELPVSIYPDRKSLWKYTGFRHINGPKQWDSFSKAKYVAHVHESYGYGLETIANTIGDRFRYVERIYRGYKVLQQAEAQCSFDIEDRVKFKFAFSHLYTALDDKEFRNFLGIRPETSFKNNPVPRKKLQYLCELMTWLYGQKSRKIGPVIRTQAKDLWRLQAVISKPSSLSALRSGLSLDRAHDISLGDKRRFSEGLIRAKEELQQARGTGIGYQGEDDLFETI